MPMSADDVVMTILEARLGRERADWLRSVVAVPAMPPDEERRVGRVRIAMAMNLILFANLVEQVPAAAAYVDDRRRAGEAVCFDHGALRTVDWPEMGALPPGRASVARFLEPLGYREAGIYPLDRLGMTGYAYRHQDMPEALAQFFVSEFHVARFPEAFQARVARVVAESTDPLPDRAIHALGALVREGGVPLGEAITLVGDLVDCFDVHHPPVRVDDYEALLAESAEMAWIATEGNRFNHATDRVADVDATAAEQRRLGRPIKDTVEVSSNGTVRQTAFRAARVRRTMIDGDGRRVLREVPGSFYEFITRDRITDPASGERVLDLRFDSGNAQGIFTMTDDRAR